MMICVNLVVTSCRGAVNVHAKDFLQTCGGQNHSFGQGWILIPEEKRNKLVFGWGYPGVLREKIHIRDPDIINNHILITVISNRL